jgi:hypothetical protein
MDYAKHLIERIAVAPEHDRVGTLSNELLREFHRGYPLDDLRQLLKSNDEQLVAIAAWITSELGANCRPLLPDVVPLLTHPMQRIRYWALDSLFWTLPQNGCDLAHAVRLLRDSEEGIRRKVLDLLFRLSNEQIEAAYQCKQEGVLESSLRDGLGWLLSADSLVPTKVESVLRGRDSTLRKFGAVAAARLRKTHAEPLLYASTMDDADAREFAARVLRA